ncbi:hypothetical protein [Nigerium massiliense]|uniref:hypothetical protein n=1 Tax=Nigerium massiliense TaxID=1522317 RepID=UPI00059170F4|nr:hypothetical protein [Nigerium massiliense]
MTDAREHDDATPADASAASAPKDGVSSMRTDAATLSAPVGTAEAAAQAGRAGATEADPHAVARVGASDLNPKTGEPRRPWYVWAPAVLLLAGAALAVAGLLLTFWISVDRFAEASWLNGAVPSEPGGGIRVMLVLAQVALVLLVAALASIAAHYSWAGYAWPRWWALAATAAALSLLMINPLASWAIAPIALAALLLWTPPLRRFADRWWEHRHPVVPAPERAKDVVYGPLPRFR